MSRLPRSVRLPPHLEEMLQRAARRKGILASHLIREAVAIHCQRILEEDPLELWNGFLGAAPTWAVPPERSAGTDFERYIEEKHEPRRRRKLP